MATAVANALHIAHGQGIVHRDIKPANILLSRGEPLVADFGIALAVGAAGGSRLTETGLSVGTPFYMSSDQATGDQAVGAASDTYALACVLYDMLVGEPAYLGNTAQAVLGKIIQGLPVSATSIRKSIPANVDAAIRKALEKLPADRFTDAHFLVHRGDLRHRANQRSGRARRHRPSGALDHLGERFVGQAARAPKPLVGPKSMEIVFVAIHACLRACRPASRLVIDWRSSESREAVSDSRGAWRASVWQNGNAVREMIAAGPRRPAIRR